MNEYSLEAALYLHDVMMVTEIIALIIDNINSYTSRHGNNVTSDSQVPPKGACSRLCCYPYLVAFG